MPKKFTILLTEIAQVKEWLAIRRLELVELERKIVLGEQWLATQKIKEERCLKTYQKKNK